MELFFFAFIRNFNQASYLYTIQTRGNSKCCGVLHRNTSKQDIKKTQTFNLNIDQTQHLCFRCRLNRKMEPWSCSLPTHRENILAVFHSYRSVQCFTIWVCLMKLSAVMTIFGCTPEVCSYSFAGRFSQGVIPEWKKFQMSLRVCTFVCVVFQ